MVNVNKNPTTLTSIQSDVLTGLMLGDGCLSIRKQCVSPRLTIRRQLRDLPYLQWQFDIFRNMCSDKAVLLGSTFDKRYDKTYQWCNLESRYIPAFLPVQKKWYPVKKKIVPSDLALNPMIISVWLGDDGSIKIVNEQRINIRFHTQGFTKDEVYFLCSLLDERYDVKFRVQSAESGTEKYTISGSDHQCRPLLKDIDSVFPISMSRKSDIWRNPSVHFYHDEPKQFSGYNADKIRENVEKKLLLSKIFTIKSICEELGLFYESKGGNFQAHSTVKSYIANQIKNGRITALQEVKILSFNTELSMSK